MAAMPAELARFMAAIYTSKKGVGCLFASMSKSRGKKAPDPFFYASWSVPWPPAADRLPVMSALAAPAVRERRLRGTSQ